MEPSALDFRAVAKSTNAIPAARGLAAIGAMSGSSITWTQLARRDRAQASTGRDAGHYALAAQAERAPECQWIGLEITEPSPEPHASDPILKGGQWIGHVSLARHGNHIGKHLAPGYIKAGALSLGMTSTPRILGREVPAVRLGPHVYDPAHRRMKAC